MLPSNYNLSGNMQISTEARPTEPPGRLTPLDGKEAKTKLVCLQAHRGTLAECDHHVVALLFGRTFFTSLAPCSDFRQGTDLELPMHG